MKYFYFLFLFLYSNILFSQILIPYRKGEKWGFCDINKNIIIQPKFEEVVYMNNNTLFVKSDTLWGIINQNNKVIVPFQYEGFVKYSDKLIIAIKNKKEGLIDTLGNIKLEIIFDQINYSLEGMFWTKNEGEFQYYDSLFNKIYKSFRLIDYHEPYNFNNGLACINNNGIYGYIDKKGNIAIPFEYEYASYFNQGYAIAIFNNQNVIIDKENNKTYTLKYDEFGCFYDSLCVVKIYNDNSNEEVIKYRKYIYQGIEQEIIHLDGNYGYIDIYGKQAINCSFIEAYFFINGLAPVTNNWGWNMINKKGEFIFKEDYYEMGRMIDGLAKVAYKEYTSRGDRPVYYGFIDMNEKVVIPFIYQDIGEFYDELAYFKKDNKYGFLNKKGKIVIPNKYEMAGDFSNGVAEVKFNGKIGYISTKGIEFWEK